MLSIGQQEGGKSGKLERAFTASLSLFYYFEVLVSVFSVFQCFSIVSVICSSVLIGWFSIGSREKKISRGFDTLV